MNTFETTATVEERGTISLGGVPFEPGTQVEVTIRAKAAAATGAALATDRVSRLFAALDKARNTEPVGPLRREELYDRQVLR